MVNDFTVSSRVLSLLNKKSGRKSWSDEKLLSKALSAKTDRAYWNAVHELRGRASASLYARCMEMTGSECPTERAAGVTILAQLYRKNTRKKYGVEYPYQREVLRLFLEMLAVSKDERTTVALLYGIGSNNIYIKSKEIDVILPFASAENSAIRRATVSALTGISKMKAIRCLIRLSNDRYAHIRDWATFALGTQLDTDNAEIREALYARCTDKHHDTRMEAIYGLSKRKDAGVKPYLEKEISGWTVYVLESIQELGATEYLPRLEEMLEKTENNPDTIQYWLDSLKECIESLRSERISFR